MIHCSFNRFLHRARALCGDHGRSRGTICYGAVFGFCGNHIKTYPLASTLRGDSMMGKDARALVERIWEKQGCNVGNTEQGHQGAPGEPTAGFFSIPSPRQRTFRPDTKKPCHTTGFARRPNRVQSGMCDRKTQACAPAPFRRTAIRPFIRLAVPLCIAPLLAALSAAEAKRLKAS